MSGNSPSPISPEQAVEGLFELLDKTAAEADSLEQQVRNQAREIEALKQQQTKVAGAPLLDQVALLKMATVLEQEQLLPEGMDAKQASESITRNPNILLRWMQNLAAPIRETEGRPVKAASTEIPKLSGDGKLVKIGDNVVKDLDGWSSCLTS